MPMLLPAKEINNFRQVLAVIWGDNNEIGNLLL